MKQRSLHKHARKPRKGHRRKGILWEYTSDGIFYFERIKGVSKKYWRRWLKRQNKRELDTFRNF
jgi:hypothetical protein